MIHTTFPLICYILKVIVKAFVYYIAKLNRRRKYTVEFDHCYIDIKSQPLYNSLKKK